MHRTPRELSLKLQWFPARRCFRFKYRDPHNGKPKLFYCVPDRFRQERIPLANPDVVRKPTKTAQNLARQLQIVTLKKFQTALPEDGVTRISAAIEEYFRMKQGRQIVGYQKTLRAIFTEFMELVGDKPVNDIRGTDLKAYEEALSGRDLSSASVRSYMRQLSMLLTYCWREGWLKRDPRLNYDLPPEEEKDPNPFSEDELTKFFDLVREQEWDHLWWMGVGFLTLGLRPVELEHARWENLQDERFLFIEKSHSRKIKQARRNHPIPLVAWPIFLKRRKKEGFIWEGFRQEQCTVGVQQRWRQNLQEFLPWFQWKRFRKTYSTILHEHGVDDIIVSRLLRHSAGGKSISIAQRHYVGRNDLFLRTIVDEAFERFRGLAPFPRRQPKQ
jgi:integrase